jgi:hypothetical protein
MNKFITGILALVLAAGLCAFKIVKKTDIRFEYQLSTWTQSQVENTANYAPGGSMMCEGFDKACAITVDEANTLNGGTQLDATKVVIQAQDLDANTNYGIDNVSTTTGSPAWENCDFN